MLRMRGTIERVTDYPDRGAPDPDTGQPAGETTLRVKNVATEPQVAGFPDEVRLTTPQGSGKFDPFRAQVGGPVDITVSIPGVDH